MPTSCAAAQQLEALRGQVDSKLQSLIAGIKALGDCSVQSVGATGSASDAPNECLPTDQYDKCACCHYQAEAGTTIGADILECKISCNCRTNCPAKATCPSDCPNDDGSEWVDQYGNTCQDYRDCDGEFDQPSRCQGGGGGGKPWCGPGGTTGIGKGTKSPYKQRMKLAADGAEAGASGNAWTPMVMAVHGRTIAIILVSCIQPATVATMHRRNVVGKFGSIRRLPVAMGTTQDSTAA